MTKRSFSVLGHPRSGTSLTTGILAEEGIHVDNDFKDADNLNADGYFESKQVFEMQGQITQLIGHEPTKYLNASWMNDERLSGISTKPLIERLDKYDYWAWKADAPFLPFFARELNHEHRCIMIVRNPLSCALSNQNKANWSLEFASSNWLTYYLILLRNLKAFSWLLLFYEDFFRATRANRKDKEIHRRGV